ncbi:bifunctional UDP-N-acetylmuramoyl-tripeptide:D-alanyl-D-alanine ligase/alanine racemase [Schleiferia thermophila]|uniref:bifunctional UDP-N-acetylmuramoyl-tripeptide:D-alanyl-D-alanine ligase/alanine racemase n=1 Tax=Schleiferia thermophila TaxID=884107 RepID=UPI003EEB83CE
MLPVNHPKPYTVVEIAHILKADIFGSQANNHILIRNLWTDTRQSVKTSESIFFCLRGPHFDGHNFLDEAAKKGMFCCVVDCLPEQLRPDVTYLMVRDTKEALQQLAAHHRSQLLETRFIAITGSNGKTMVKEWLYDLLHPHYNCSKSPLSYNSQIGVPLSVWKCSAENQFAIIEAGISLPGEMERLRHIIQPQIGVFTHLGSAHDAGFQSREQKLAEKARLFHTCESILVGADQPDVVDYFRKIYPEKKLLTVSSTCTKADFTFQTNASGEVFFSSKHYDLERIKISSPFKDIISNKNLILALSAGLVLTDGNLQLIEKIPTLFQVRMRMEWTRGLNDCMILNDCYTSDPEALQQALQTLLTSGQYRKKIIVLSEFDQLTEADEQMAFSTLLETLKSSEKLSDTKVLYVGADKFEKLSELPVEKAVFTTTQHLLSYLKKNPPTQSDILLKGARKFQFESIAEQLSASLHETRVEINLSAIGRNLSFFKSLLPVGTKLMAMVKAASYGSGSFELARYLASLGVDYLAVAYADEGVELRNAHITMPVMVMNAHTHLLPLIFENNLEPQIFSFGQINFLKNFETNSPLSIHIKIDTGMHRLGFKSTQLKTLLNELSVLKETLRVRSILSHLSAADDPKEDKFTHWQIEQFHRAADQIDKVLGYHPIRHIFNTAGILDHMDERSEMVRIGIGMYGISHRPDLQIHLQPAIEWHSFVSQVKDLEPGDSIGYGRSFVATKKMKTATIALGYADGFRRILSNGRGGVYIKGIYCPVIGRICMDMTMVDVSHIPDVEEGDPVEIIGPNQAIEKLAQAINTVPYEVLTSIGTRVKRVYFKES